MEEYKELVLLLAGCWFIQIFLSYLQHKNYGKEINELKKRNTGFLGVGISKAKFNLGRGIVLLVVTDEQDCIVTYKEMAGITIFARFKEHQEFIGKKTTETMPLLANKRRKAAFEQAIQLIKSEKNRLEVV
jgi:glucitol operon activator protein